MVGAVVGGLVNVLTSGRGTNWALLSAVIVAVLGWAGIEAWRTTRGSSRPRPAAAVRSDLDDALVSRTDLTERIVGALIVPGKGPILAVVGPGGFGKTTLARMVQQDPRVVRRYGQMINVVLGQDAGDASLAAKINDVSEQLTGVRPGFSSADQAAQHLGAALDQHKDVLLVVDDLWTADQARLFRYGGKSCGRLMTTRNPNAVPAPAVVIDIGEMNREEAREVLTSGVDDLPGRTVDQLVERTGHWPLLLALANGLLRQAAIRGDDVTAVAERTLSLLDSRGPTALDSPGPGAAAPTIEASLAALSVSDRARFTELGVFAEDADIPEGLVVSLWAATGGLPFDESIRLCRMLQDLSLVAAYREGAGTLQLHDIIRAYLRSTSGADGVRRTNSVLLDVVADGQEAGSSGAWWQLPETATYLWTHLGYHLREAGRGEEFAQAALDMQWILTKLRISGAAALSDDLADIDRPEARQLTRFLAQHGHLLGPTDPPEAVLDIFLSRFATIEATPPTIRSNEEPEPRLRLIPRWPLPDIPHPALVRVLPLDSSGVARQRHLSGDGALFVSHDGDSMVIQTTDTGRTVVLEASAETWEPVWFTGDGRRLIGRQDTGVFGIWDTASGRRTGELVAHRRPARMVASAPDGAWVAVSYVDNAIRVTFLDRPGETRVLRGHRGEIQGLGVAAGGDRLVSVGGDRIVRVWRPEDGRCVQLNGHRDEVMGCIAGPGNLAVTWGDEGTVHLWDVVSGEPVGLITRPGYVVGCVLADDGSWLAVAESKTVTRWDVTTRQLLAAYHLPRSGVSHLSAGRGETVVVGTEDGAIHLWDPNRPGGLVLEGHSGPVRGAAVRPDGFLLSTADDGTRVWDPTVTESRAEDDSRREAWYGCTVAPDSHWLALWRAGTIAVHDLTRPGRVRLLDTRHEYWTTCLASDGNQLVVGEFGNVALWNVNVGVIQGSISFDLGDADSLAFGRDKVFTGGTSEVVQILDLRTWDVVGYLDSRRGRVHPPGAHRAPITLRTVLRRARRLFGSIAGSRLVLTPIERVWALRPVQWTATKTRVIRLTNATVWIIGDMLDRLLGPYFISQTVIGSKDGRSMWTLQSDGLLRRWAVEDLEPDGFARDTSLDWSWSTRRAAATTDGESLVYVTEAAVRKWGPGSDDAPRTLATIPAAEGRVTALAFDSDLRFLCAVTDTGTIIVFRADDWSRVAMQRVDGALHSCSFLMHDGSVAVVAAGSRGAFLWALQDTVPG